MDERIDRGFEAVGFRSAKKFEFVQAAEQAAESELFRGGRLPGRQRASGTKAGDDLGIDLVGLVAAAKAAGVVFDAARVGNVHLQACVMKGESRQIAVTTGGFEDDTGRGSLMFSAPGEKLLEAGFGVIELGLLWAGSAQETDVEEAFGNINAEAGGRRRTEEQGVEALLRSGG